MNDIRSALAAAIYSQAAKANQDTGPLRAAIDESIQANAAQSGQDIYRLERRSERGTQPDPHRDGAIPTRGESGGRSETGQKKSGPVNCEAPSNWNPADREAFKALPESTQDFILRQCRRIETELGKKSEQLAVFHREYEPIAKIIEPFAGRLNELNLTPRAAIQRYIDIERRLAAGDGVAVIKGLVHGYKVAPHQVIEALDPKLSDTRLTSLSDPLQRDRQLSGGVMRQFDQPEHRETADGREPTSGAETAAARRDFESRLEQFKAAQDAAGNPLHPHYADVEPEMAALALAYSSRGRRIPPLKALYENAVWTNPALRTALVSAQQGSKRTTDNVESTSGMAGRKPALSSSAGESKRALTRQSHGQSLRDEILAHVGRT